MKIRNRDHSSSFLPTSSRAPPAAAVPDALISDTLVVLGMKSFTEPINPTPNPVVLNHHHESNLPISAAKMVGTTKPNHNVDNSSDSSKLMQTQTFPAIPNKEEGEEKEISSFVTGGEEEIRVCTVNKSPWNVPSFGAFLTNPTNEPADQFLQNNSSRNYEKKIAIQNLPSYSFRKEKTMVEANQQAYVEDEDDVNTTEMARMPYTRKAETKKNPMPFGQKEVSQVAEKEKVLESALMRVFSEEVAGLTVREAASKLMLRNINNVTSEGLPLSVQVRRAMHNSPYFVQMDNGKFSLWDNFLNSSVGRLDKEERTSLEIEKIMGSHKFDREEDCASSKEPARKLGQLADTNLELAVPKIVTTKGKRGRRAGLGLGKEKEDIGICRLADGKRPKSCGQEVEQRPYNSVCRTILKINEAFHSIDKTAVGFDSPCCHRQSISDGNGKTHQNDFPLLDEPDRAAASCLISFQRDWEK